MEFCYSSSSLNGLINSCPISVMPASCSAKKIRYLKDHQFLSVISHILCLSEVISSVDVGESNSRSVTENVGEVRDCQAPVHI